MFIFDISIPFKFFIMRLIKTVALLLVISMGFCSVVVASTGNKCHNEKSDPVINSIYPEIGHQGQTLTVSISGQNTHFTQGTNMIWFEQGTSTIYAYNIIPVSDTILNATFTLPFAPLGYYNVNGYNSYDGALLPLENGFLLKGTAYLTGISPTQGMLGTEINLTINGENTSFASADELIAALIKNSDTLYLNVNAVDESTLIASVLIPYTANTGYYNLYVFNNYDGDLFLYNVFYIEPNPVCPEITSVSPDSIPVDYVSQVTINCQNTHFSNNNTEVWLTKGSQTIDASSVTINSTLQLIVSLNTFSAELGFWDVNAKNDYDGHIILPQGIKIYETSGINEVFDIANLNVYPNPCFDYLNISGKFPQNESITIRIIDTNGKEVIRKNENFENLNSYSLNLSGLKKGVYFIQFSNKKGMISKKILKVSGN